MCIIFSSFVYVLMGKMNQTFIELFYSLSSFGFFQLNGYFAKFAEFIEMMQEYPQVIKITFMSL